MRRTIAVALVLLSSVSPHLAAQTTNTQMRSTVPSPTAASLGKFGDIPISYYTGVPSISIPLFTAKGKTLELPISLDYHASGIKVEEVGGWVGAGWALEAGGVITRTVHGIVDEQTEGYFNTGHTFYVAGNWTFPPPVTLVRNIHDDQTQDGEPDQFFFNFAGSSGEMVGGDTSATHTSTSNIFVAIPYRKWRIEPQMGNDPWFGTHIIQSWTITTESGTKYTFGAYELHVDRETQWSEMAGRNYKPYVSAWYLTKIRAASGDSILFDYADYQAEHHQGLYREEVNDLHEANAGDCALPGYWVGSSNIYDLHTQSYVYAKRLASITSAGHVITFTHSLRDDARSPLYSAPNASLWGASITNRQRQEPKLDLMTVTTPQGAVLRKFEFEYTYGGPLGGRLTLLNVYEEDALGTRLPPYSFTYDGPTLPARVTDRTDYHAPTLTASFALDHWGYYNGATTNTTLIPPGTSAYSNNSYPGANRKPAFNFMKAGSLIKVTYPTGGFNEFVYEANDYSWGAEMIQPDDLVFHQEAIAASPDATKDFTIGGPDPTLSGTLSVWVSQTCTGPTELCPYVTLTDVTTGQQVGRWTTARTDQAITLRNHSYRMFATTQGRSVTININVKWWERVVVTKMTGPGLRIKEVRANDGMGNVTVRRYGYQLSDGRSSGWITLGPRYDYNRNVISNDNMKQCIYYSRSSSPRSPQGSGSTVTYNVVTESLGGTGLFGSTRRTFAAGCDCAAAASAANANKEWPFLRYTTDAWRRGHQQSTEDFSASGAIQRATAATFSNPPPSHPTIAFRGLASDVYSMWSQSTVNGLPHNTYYIWAWQFQVETALKVQTDQTTTVYDTTGTSSFSTTQQFTYGNPSHAQLTEITETNSDGTQRITRMTYPADYAACSGTCTPEAAALTAMQGAAHMHNWVVERWVIGRTGSVEKVVDGQLTTYKEYAPGQYLPYQRLVLNSPSPLP
jgi:hypothetical protein